MNRIRCVLLPLLCITTSSLAFAEKPAPGTQVQQSFETSDGAAVPYLLYLPKDYQAGKEFPLMLFLHGRGESHGPLDLVAKWGPPRMAARGDDLPFIVVSPQCPGADRWSSDQQQQRLSELLDEVVNKFAADKSRLYLTGLSMGGFGSWRMAADQPDRFAAVVPICGKGDPEHGEKLKDIPIWVFHGDQDKAVPFEHSVDMVEAIKQAGGTKVRFTTLEGIGHNSWSAAYATPELYGWMLQQSRREPE
jgi:predicted peptidase